MLSLWAQGGPDEELPPLSTKHNTHFEMMSFSMDPQWCGLLFSLYCRHEKGALLSGSGMPQTDAFAISSLPGPPLEADWIAIASSFGFEICHLSSTWALIFESVKATGVILLLGVGSLVCYKICNHYWPRRRPRSRSSFQRHRRDSSPSFHGRNPSGAYVTEDTDAEELLEDLEEGELNGIEGRYFGPEQIGGEEEEDGMKDRRDACYRRLHTKKPSHENTYSGSCAQSIYHSSSTSQSESTTSGEDEGRDADISEGSLIDRLPRHYSVLQNQPAKEQHARQSLSWSGAQATPPKRASRPTSFDGSFMEHLSQKYSGCLINRISKLISSTPETLQLSGSAMRKLQLKSGSNTKLNRSGKTSLIKWQKGKTNALRRAGQMTEKECEKSSTEHSRVDMPWATQAYSVPSSLRRDESYDSLGFPRRLNRDGSFDSTCSDLSMDFSLPESTVEADTSTMLCMEKLQEEIDQLKTNCLLMDEEFETIKCNRNLPGMSSLMKANVPDSNLMLTSRNQDKDDTEGEHEVDRIKEEKARECFTGLYSLTTIKHSTSSELSDSYPMVQGDTFAQESIGSAESLAWDSPHLAASPTKLSTGEVESLFSSPVKEMEANKVQSCFPFPDKECCVDETYILQPNEISEATVLSQSDDELMANLEWDEDGLEYPDDNITTEDDSIIPVATDDIGASLDILGRNMEDDIIYNTTLISNIKHEAALVDPESAFGSMTSSLTASMMTERSSKMDSSGFDTGSQMVDSCTSLRSSQLASDCEVSIGKKKENTAWNCNDLVEWDSTIKSLNLLPSPSLNSESGTAQQTWEDTSSEMSTPASELPLSDMLSPVSSSESSAIGVENVGQRVNLMQYAVREWQGHTKKAETILKGYAEIPSLLGFQYLRRIRGDNYCGVRASIFQALAQGIPIPNGAKTFQYLSQAINNKKCEWIHTWNFSGRLPYHGNDVIHGMEVCLQNLDNVVSLLSSCNGNQEDTLAALLNTDPIMDLHIVEAVKLQMLQHAMQLHETNLSGLEVPFFAVLMFARDTSETPKDFMNNHLREVGNTGGLEQVEMFLLGYTLGVTIRVVRPSAYGTDEFICSYPDYNEGNLPQIFLIAEDDRHYNVLVN